MPDSNPLKYYLATLNLAKFVLLQGGKIYFEINEAMGEEMTQLLNSKNYSGIEIINDLNGKKRIIKGIRNV